MTLIAVLLIGSCGYDDSLVRENIDAIEEELAAAENALNAMEGQMKSLTDIVNSDFVSYLNVDEKGNAVLTYMKDGKTYTLSLALQSDVVTQPIVAAREEGGVLYWALTKDNGKTYEWILQNGEKMAVGGSVPDVGIDSEGYWTVNGARCLDASGNPVLANDVSNTLFKNVELVDGFAVFTMIDGTTFRVQYFEALGIEFDCPAIIGVDNVANPVVVSYNVTGSLAENAVVDYFTAYNVDVTIDVYAKKITLNMHAGASEANTVIMVTSGETTVLKPIFMTAGAAVIENPKWDSAYGVGTAVQLPGELTEFDVEVSANVSYDVVIDPECASWLRLAPASKAEMVKTAFKFVADYYENPVGADRLGKITFANAQYGVSVEMVVRQSPVIPQGPTVPGIANGGDLVAFAKAVNSGSSIDRWKNEAGEIVLLNDIDLTGLTEWTPIGSGIATGKPAYGTLVAPFEGVFNGQGYTIKGIQWTFDSANPATNVFGFFGALKGATVKNLVLGADGDGITVTGATENTVAVGAVVGYAESSQLINVRNNLNVTLVGDNPSSVLMMLGGIAGCMAESKIGGESKDEGCVNAGNVTTGKISNEGNGGTGMQVGGICAFTLNNCRINYAVNYGEVSAPTGRGGGLVGTMGGGTTADANTTIISNSDNRGLVQDDAVGQYGGAKTAYGNKRMGGLVGGTVTNNDGLRIEYCTNYGNVFSQIGCRAGGFVGHNQAKIVGCVNKGVILGNITANEKGEPQHGPGWACGFSAKGLVTGCVRGGKVGEWDTYKDNPDAAPEATNDNAFCYANDRFDPTLNQ